MKSVNVQELKKMMDEQQDFALFDVREQYEFDAAQMGGILIPMNEVPVRYAEIPKDKKTVIHCRSGARSANVIHWLEQNHGYDNLYNLEGGIKAWAEEIDPALTVM